MPQWVFGVTTGEAAAMYCFFSIIITGSFMPYFKRFFAAREEIGQNNPILVNR
jgi:hypothetical protein